MAYERPPGERARNDALAAAIARDGRPRYVLAGLAHINATSLGGIVSGRVRPTAAVRARVAAVLGRPEHELFEGEPAEASS